MPSIYEDTEEGRNTERADFPGFPSADFEKAGREQLSYLLLAGLNPDSRLVDVGCGVLRPGYWLIHFLDSGCYFGIEPHKGRLEMGVNIILEPEVLKAKRPRFDTNPHFDTSVFGEKFDFFLAYSIWTHASKRQIQTMLDSFLRDSTEGGIFLTSYCRQAVRILTTWAMAGTGPVTSRTCPVAFITVVAG